MLKRQGGECVGLEFFYFIVGMLGTTLTYLWSVVVVVVVVGVVVVAGGAVVVVVVVVV